MEDLGIRIDIDDKAIDPNEVSFWLTMSAISSFLIWGTFVVFYFSRLSAIFCTFVLDKYLRLSKEGIHFRIGSISISGLHAGKIMFRNVIYDNGDFTVKINDGHLVFKFWKPVESRHLNLKQKRASRLHLVLNGLHINVYNNLTKYAEIARIRRFSWFFEGNNMGDMKKPNNKPPDTTTPSSVWENVWNLLGIVNVEVSSGCLLLGNKFLPYALWTRFENLTSKTSVGESRNDRALITFEGETENVSISLIKNEEFTGKDNLQEPPRTTGNDGFPLLQTASLVFIYKQDMLGYVTDDEPQSITSKVPVWSSEWRFGANTVFSYGPWAEQQRVLIYSFFYPADYQTVPVTVMPSRGQRRIHIKHDVNVILTKESCMDIWFMRGGQLESIRTRCGPQSRIDMSILWIATEKGTYWTMKAEFSNFETTTSLLFTKLLECQRFRVNGSFSYPLTWNGEQLWTLEYTFHKASAWFVWDHKRLFTDLINDWMGEDPSDITKFVPFRVFNKMKVVDSFEVIMLLNECNWVDTSDKNAENVEVAIVGETLIFECELPFIDFLPQMQKLKYHLKGVNGIAMRGRFPPDSATEPIRAALYRLARCNPFASPSVYGTYSLDKETWFEMWRTEKVEMKFDHAYHPFVLRKNVPSDIPFPILSEYLPERPVHPWGLEPDYLGVEIVIEGSDVKFTGLLIKLIFELKNNYFGWYDSMTSIDSLNAENNTDASKMRSAFDKTPADADVELYRTMDCDVTVRVSNIRAELLIYSPATDSDYISEKCPSVLIEEVAVEVKKTKTQSLIQVGISPACAYFEKSSYGTTAGCLTLSGLQFRGHAMYSATDVTWDMGVTEYGWIMEILVGDINGTLDIPSHFLALHQIIESVLIFTISPDDASKIPERMQFCHHGQLTKSCSIAGKKNGEERSTCRTEEKLKYRQIRVSLDSINLAFVEEKTIVQACVDPVRITVCNAHEGRFTEHVCVRVPGVTIKQAVRVGSRESVTWVEGASANIEGISLDIELPNDLHSAPDLENERCAFIKLHDENTKRLHFLWAEHSVWGCACFGNTTFFGDVDTIGSTFMETLTKRKFFVPGIEKSPELQPKVLQSVLNKGACILTGQPHVYYRKPKRAENIDITNRKESSTDTESFHSAKSRQATGRRLLQSNEMTQTYSEFINNLNVVIPDTSDPPSFGQPGTISKWCRDHPATVLSNDTEKGGVNDVKFNSKNKKTESIFNVVDKKDADVNVEFDLNRSHVPKKRRLAISGTAATSIDVFFSLIGLEGLERIVSTTSHTIAAINPCLLVHIIYRECILKKHRQPLTDSLFLEENEEAELAPELEILIDLPKINVGLFQCGIKKNVVKTNTFDHRTANLALFLIDRASIQSEVMIQKSEGGLKTTSSIDSISTKSMVYHLKCNGITAQILQLSNRSAADFGNSSSTTTTNNWEQCTISKRMMALEPRVMLDFNISDVSVILERRPIITQIANRSNTMSINMHSPVPNSTPVGKTPAPTPEVPTPLKKKKRVIYEHYLKAAVGSVNTSVVMARPQELTAGDEFPIYEALAPVMVSWLSVLDNFAYATNKLIRQWECWKIVALAKVLKLALDCTDEKVAVKLGKNRMASTRVLGSHQGSCPSCMLLRTLFRWFAYAQTSPEAVSEPLNIRTEFEVEATRKTALMALLSHWQSDIGKELKLVSYKDANRFKVTRPDEAAIVALTKMSKRVRKQKGPAKPVLKKETRIVVEGNQRKANDKRKPSKIGRMSPAPLLRKLRLKTGTDDDEDDEADYSSYIPLKKSNGDIEMQEFTVDSEAVSYDEEGDELEDEHVKKNENVDLYTWMRNAQRESALRRRKTAGGNEATESELIVETSKEKEYLNPMDIQQKAFYYTIYRWAKLQWTTLDNVESDHFHIDYSFLLREVDVRMMAKSIKSSTDQKRRYITPDQQKVMQIRNAAVSGGMVWNLERDEKKKVPLSGQWNISYSGNVEGIRFLIGMATVSLGKELSLVLQAATEAKHELNIQSVAETTPHHDVKRWSENTQYDHTAEWDEKVLDMTKDYEKHMKRMKTAKQDGSEEVRLFVNGNASISSVVLESVLNDLYVSAMILKIEVAHSKKPIPEIVQTSSVTVSTIDERKTATLTRKSTSNILNNKVDDIAISLTKMSLTLSESDLNKKSDILRCSLNSSTLNYFTRLQPLTNKDGKVIKSSSSIASNNQQILGSWATLKLGALEGNMPMAAHSLHDVVMRHGKELEQQFNRLSAQPASTPLGNPGFTINDEPLLSKLTDHTQETSEISTVNQTPNLIHQQTPIKAVLTDAAAVISTLRETNEKPKYQVARRVPIAVVNFVLEITSIEMNVQVLPSLQAKYKIYRASSNGVTGDKAKWTISVDEHFFEFCVTGQGGKTETFRLQLPSIKCTGHYSVEQDTASHKPSTDKKLIYREGGSLQMTVLLGPVNHTFTTELLNQLMFAENSFRAELTSLINRIRSSSTSTPGRSPMVSPPSVDQDSSSSLGTTYMSAASTSLKLDLPIHRSVETPSSSGNLNARQNSVQAKPPLLFAIKVLTRDPKSPKLTPSPDKASTPWLQLTAATPTQTAVRLTIDSLEGELTNKWVVKEEGSKERIYGSAVVHFNAKLGQLVKAAQYEEVSSEMQEYATFMTQVRVENKERNKLNSSYSYHISLNRPILLVKAAAIDKAVLLWLNYKNTYDYWRDEREKVVQEKTTKKRANTAGMFSPSTIVEDADMNLSLAINNGMYMCMPLYSYDVTEGMPALVVSLQKSELSVLVKRELTCKASFNGFKMSFIDDFDEQALTQSFLDAAHSEQSNCIFFPEGTYQLCTKLQTHANNGPARWVLSVSAEMQGVEIDLDQRIGKLAKLLVNTCSMIGKNDDDEISFLEDQRELDSDEEKVEGAAELKRLKAEERVPWMENKMHEHSRAVFELASRGVSTKKLEAEKHKLRQYELIRFKAFRRNFVEKLKNGTSTQTQQSSEIIKADIERRDSKTDASLTLPKTEDTTQLSNKNEPDTVNFNLDVKVNITSGTCTLRTSKKEGSVQMNFPGQIGEALKRLNQGNRDIKAMFEPPTLTTTNFSIPSVEIKAYHVSDPDEKTSSRFGKSLEKNEKLPKGLGRDAEKLNKDLNSKSRFGYDSKSREQTKQTNEPKRGCFYIFIGLASMPSETVVTPHLATYFEQVLEPLPPSAVFQSQNSKGSQVISTIDQKLDSKEEINNIVAMDTAALPIDFVLYLDVQSSTIRFDGKQQTTRNQAQADCLLTLPRLTLELTTKRSNDNVDNYVGGIYISGQFKGFMLKIYNPLEPELDSSRALQLSLDLLSFVISRNKNSSSEQDNRVRFVFTSQIGKASFEYNFRRLGELIQFPKPWYRATIARRVFFGDQAAPRAPRDDCSDATGTTKSRIPTNKQYPQPSASVVSTESSNVHVNQSKPWTAVVLAALQWNEFEITAFMSNTMGKTTWNASKGLLWADAKLNSSTERDVNVTFVLGSSELCAREGAISGLVKLNNLRISAAHSLWADLRRPPVHKAKLKVEWISANVEWMSRRVLIGKWTGPAFKVADFYKGVKEGEQLSLAALGMDVEASWKNLQVVITKSTIDDIKAIVSRLISFFEEQLKNSRLLLGSFSNPNIARKQEDVLKETRKPKTHFWEKVLDYVSEMQINEQLMPLMELEGASVGGHVQLKAGGISLVLMKGDMNSDTWAIFHLQNACISFDPEARMDFLDKLTKQKIGINLKQNFTLKLGSKKENKIDNLANVCRVQTRTNASRHMQKTDEILDYFIGEVLTFLGLQHDTHLVHAESSPKLAEKSSKAVDITLEKPTDNSPTKARRSSKTKSKHTVLELFQFPGLEAVMTTEQLNGLDDGDKYESAFQLPMEVFATVVCDFFSDVAIETDFNAQVSFLPELLKSYLKEKPNINSATSSISSPASISASRENTLPDEPKDQRQFICKEWIVDPRVRFIDRIKWKPPVVDEILRKLQIFDHRNTIPKVIQRVVLDPLDATLASSVIATLELIDNKKTIRKFKKSRADVEPKKDGSLRIDVPAMFTGTPTGMSLKN